MSHVRSEGRRVVPSDTHVARTNNPELNQKLNIGQRDAKTDRVKQPYENISPFHECQRLTKQGYKPHQIAVKMKSKGYSTPAIKRAMKLTVPACRKMSQKQFNDHWKQHIQPSMRTKKAIRNQAQEQRFKQKHGIQKSFTNAKGLDTIKKEVNKQAHTQKAAKVQHDRTLAGQNHKAGFQKQAVKNQTRTPANQNRKPQLKQAAPAKPNVNYAAARQRAQTVQQQPPARGRRR